MARRQLFQTGVRVYPFSTRANAPTMEWSSVSVIDPETRGLLASIGITKDAPFEPDERMRTILTEAAAVGNGTARAIAFRSREADCRVYEDRRWVTPFPGDDFRFLRDGGRGGRFQDARTMFFYLATVNTPAMALKMVGKGSQYALATVDANDAALDGAKTYRLHLLANAPAADFWSVVVYDPQTRSELQTGQPLPSRNSKRDALDYNNDGSVDIVFGPEEPQTLASNWIQTVAGKGWFALIRLYGPLEPWFDHTWRPSDIEPV